MWATLLRALLDALFGALVAGISEWRRDRSLERLGYTEAQRDQARTTIEARLAADRARREVRDAAAAGGDPPERVRRFYID